VSRRPLVFPVIDRSGEIRTQRTRPRYVLDLRHRDAVDLVSLSRARTSYWARRAIEPTTVRVKPHVKRSLFVEAAAGPPPNPSVTDGKLFGMKVTL